MSKKIVYTDEPMEVGERIFDLIPPPNQLIRKNVKITLELTPESVSFFKSHAEKLNVPYTRMMRSALDYYVAAHQETSK